MSRLAAGMVLMGIALLLLAPAEAAEVRPGKLLAADIQEAVGVVANGALGERAKRERLGKIIMPWLDVPEIVRRTLGPHYRRHRDRVPEFTQVFLEFLEWHYVPQMLVAYAKGGRVVITRELVEDDRAAVETKIVTARGQGSLVGFRLHPVGDDWKVYDISIEGVSFVATYRVWFNKILTQHSLDGLLAHLRERVREAQAAAK